MNVVCADMKSDINSIYIELNILKGLVSGLSTGEAVWYLQTSTLMHILIYFFMIYMIIMPFILWVK